MADEPRHPLNPPIEFMTPPTEPESDENDDEPTESDDEWSHRITRETVRRWSKNDS
jgi:hypothetical protein